MPAVPPAPVGTPSTSKLSGSYNGLSWGPGSAFHCAGMEGFWDLPDIVVTDSGKATGDGLFAGIDRKGGRSVVLTLVIIADDVAGYDNAVISLINATDVQTVDKQLLFWNSTRYIMARPRRRSIPVETGYFQRTGTAVIEFFAVDPTVYTV